MALIIKEKRGNYGDKTEVGRSPADDVIGRIL